MHVHVRRKPIFPEQQISRATIEAFLRSMGEYVLRKNCIFFEFHVLSFSYAARQQIYMTLDPILVFGYCKTSAWNFNDAGGCLLPTAQLVAGAAADDSACINPDTSQVKHKPLALSLSIWKTKIKAGRACNWWKYSHVGFALHGKIIFQLSPVRQQKQRTKSVYTHNKARSGEGGKEI